MTRETFDRVSHFVNDMRPTDLEPFAAILSSADMDAMRALNSLGHFMKCAETGRYFCPALCVRP